MASLKEIKGRIASVNSTLKITSAMKMVASAKLHKAQNAIGNMVPYESRLRGILSSLLGTVSAAGVYTEVRKVEKVALVCFSSNSSLCGAFNSNAIREANKTIAALKAEGVSEITVYSVGKKMAEAMKKAGYQSPADYSEISAKPSYAAAAELGAELLEGFLKGSYDRVELIYNHFKSTASQCVVRETYLPLSLDSVGEARESELDYIVEPGKEELMESLLPKVIRLKIYTVLLDTIAAEHAARTVAMQTATDNGNELLQDLTLEYNKSRQQKITSEILDIVSGSSQ